MGERPLSTSSSISCVGRPHLARRPAPCRESRRPPDPGAARREGELHHVLEAAHLGLRRARVAGAALEDGERRGEEGARAASSPSSARVRGAPREMPRKTSKRPGKLAASLSAITDWR